MDEISAAQVGVVKREFRLGLLKRLALCSLVFPPLVLVLALVNGKASFVDTAKYTASLMLLVLFLSATLDYVESAFARRRISKPFPSERGERICYAVYFDREGRGSRKRFGYLVRREGSLLFVDSRRGEELRLGRQDEIDVRESEKYYLRDPYSPRKRRMRALVEIATESGSRLFDVLVPDLATRRIGAR